MRKITLYLSAICFSIFLISSCENGKTKEENTDIKNDTVTEEKTPEKEVVKDKPSYPISTPYETCEQLQKAGGKFSGDLINPTTNSDKYLSDKDKALNLGIYGTDLGYSGVFDKTEKVKEYFIISKKLADDININTEFTRTIDEKIENKLSNKEAVKDVITQSYQDVFEYLNDNEKGEIAVFVLYGGWIETLYISTHAPIIAKDDTKILRIIAKQEVSYNLLFSLIEIFSDNKDVAEILTEMETLGNIFNSIEDKALTEKQLDELADDVKKIRNRIVLSK